MFCTKCGCRIPPEASKCPNCGADLPVMEYCGGFWSELNQNTQAGEKAGMTSDAETKAEAWDGPAGAAMKDPEKTFVERNFEENSFVERNFEESSFVERPFPEEPSDKNSFNEKKAGKPAGKSAGRAGKKSLTRYLPATGAAVLVLLLAVSLFHSAGLKRQLRETEDRLQAQQEENAALWKDYQQLAAKYIPQRIPIVVSREAKAIWTAAMVPVRSGMAGLFREEETSGADNTDQAALPVEENTDQGDSAGTEDADQADSAGAKDADQVDSAGTRDTDQGDSAGTKDADQAGPSRPGNSGRTERSDPDTEAQTGGAARKRKAEQTPSGTENTENTENANDTDLGELSDATPENT